ncbi:MAG: methylamine utilization protein [Pseudohongiellaceae bacterium]|nr:methylamine utilization protein [Pseudohongiellaceae bacterium]
MRLLHYRHAVALCTLLSFASFANAIDFSVKIIDQNGKAVSNAALEVDGTPAASNITEIAIIDQINKRFVPMVIAIQKGQQVNFPNNDNIRHHVYSFSPIKQFSTELYADIPGAPILFDKAGVATLGCNIHDSMVGYIFVSEWQNVDVTGADGLVEFSTQQTPNYINVWHPWSTTPSKQQRLSLESLSDGDIVTIEININEPNQSFGFRALREQ